MVAVVVAMEEMWDTLDFSVGESADRSERRFRPKLQV